MDGNTFIALLKSRESGSVDDLNSSGRSESWNLHQQGRQHLKVIGVFLEVRALRRLPLFARSRSEA